MKQKTAAGSILLSIVCCAGIMCYVDAVVQPGYALKSVIKITLFLLVPFCYFLANRQDFPQFKKLFVPRKRDMVLALLMGVGVFGLILGGYFLVTRFLDLTDMILGLTANAGVSPGNFLWVSIYISFVNSLLEEFLFRGFAFIVLKEKIGRTGAYAFSAVLFALYHSGMFAGSVNIPIWLAAMVGLCVAGAVLNRLNERCGNIYTSWIVHMFANFSINTVGFIVFGMI